MLNKAQIVALLETNDKAIARALVVVNNNQTADEQVQSTVKYQNGMGFRPCHARMGTSMALFFQRQGYLSAKQLAYWRHLDKTGAMRIAIYWRQLAEAAEAKAAAKVAAPVVHEPPVGDIGNMQEELMVLEEKLAELQYTFDDTQDADDEVMSRDLSERIVAMTAYIADLRKEIARAYAAM